MWINSMVIAFFWKVLLFIAVCAVIRWVWRNAFWATPEQRTPLMRKMRRAARDPLYAQRVGLDWPSDRS